MECRLPGQCKVILILLIHIKPSCPCKNEQFPKALGNSFLTKASTLEQIQDRVF